jgi:methylated-DNA-[protein]-cysteine S-methyltransferase
MAVSDSDTRHIPAVRPSSPFASAGGISLFDTSIGRCGVAWSTQGILCVQLPECDEATTQARLCEHACTPTWLEPPAPVRDAIGRIVGLLHGVPDSLDDIVLDMSAVPAFHRRVLARARHIPPGATQTYGELAVELGNRSLARAVGHALGRNPFAIVVPCHRVTAAGGKPGGFSAGGGVKTKLRLLAREASPGGKTGELFFDAL